MDRKISTTKLNTFIFLFIWLIFAVLGILKSFEVKDFSLWGIFIACTIILSIILYRKFRPKVYASRFSENSILLDKKAIYGYQILNVYETGPLGKILFALKNPTLDFTSSFYSRGLVLKTMYDSYLVNDIRRACLDEKRVAKKTNMEGEIFLFYILCILPFLLYFLSICFGIDTLLYVLAELLFIFVFLLRFMPPFYLGEKLDLSKLPLSKNEAFEFTRISIIKGFILSDRLLVPPSKKRSYLDGLAVDLIFKKYIIINPRLFALGSSSYLRFVLFHELCHIKHHDGSRAVIVPALLVALDLLFSLLPSDIANYLPYYDCIFFGAAGIYLAYIFLTRRNIETRADSYGIERIGHEGVSSIKNELGIDINTAKKISSK